MMNGRKIKIFVIEHLVCTKFRFWTTLRRMQHDAQHAPCGCAARRTIYLQVTTSTRSKWNRARAWQTKCIAFKSKVFFNSSHNQGCIASTMDAQHASWLRCTHHIFRLRLMITQWFKLVYGFLVSFVLLAYFNEYSSLDSCYNCSFISPLKVHVKKS